MKVNVKVTKAHFREAINCGLVPGKISKNCAIAIAIRELLPNARVNSNYIAVDEIDSDNNPNYKLLTIPLPVVAQKLIHMFDNPILYGKITTIQQFRLALPETSFDINIPDAVIDIIGIDEAKRILSTSKTLQLVNHE